MATLTCRRSASAQIAVPSSRPMPGSKRSNRKRSSCCSRRRRSRAMSIGRPLCLGGSAAAALRRVQCHTQCSANAVECETGQTNRQTRGVHLLRSHFHIGVGACKHRAPTRLRRLHAQAKKAQARLRQQRRSERQRHLHNHRLDHVRHDVAADEPVRRWRRSCGRHRRILRCGQSAFSPARAAPVPAKRRSRPRSSRASAPRQAPR